MPALIGDLAGSIGTGTLGRMDIGDLANPCRRHGARPRHHRRMIQEEREKMERERDEHKSFMFPVAVYPTDRLVGSHCQVMGHFVPHGSRQNTRAWGL